MRSGIQFEGIRCTLLSPLFPMSPKSLIVHLINLEARFAGCVILELEPAHYELAPEPILNDNHELE